MQLKAGVRVVFVVAVASIVVAASIFTVDADVADVVFIVFFVIAAAAAYIARTGGDRNSDVSPLRPPAVFNH